MEKIGDKYVILLFRIQYIEGDFSTLVNLHKINVNDFNILLSIFKNILQYNLQYKNEGYKTREIKNIIFSYKIISGDKLIINSSRLITRYNQNRKLTYRQSILLPLILNILDINIPEGS
jgi:hypothetical protein